jgi:hypothetical protein
VTTTLVHDSPRNAERLDPDSRPAASDQRRFERLLLGVAIALGVIVRLIPVLSFDFPLNDGGLFYQMALELQRAGYAIPDVTEYNGDHIPFAYAPLGFYVAALLGRTPEGILAAVRWIPLIVTVLGLPAFVLLARRLLPNERAVIAATFAYAVLPRAFVWTIMGGGLTRSFGMLFTVLALRQAHLMYTTRAWRHVLATAVLASLTVLSHIGTAPFLAVSSALLWIAYGRHRHGILASLVVAALTLALTAPWWGVVVAEHGLAPFRAAQASGGSVLSGSAARWVVRLALAKLTLGITGEPLFPLVLVSGLLGALIEITRRRWVLPVWWLLIVLAELRAPGTYSAIPIAMLAGVAVTEALAPLLRRWRENDAALRPPSFTLAGVNVSRWSAVVLAGMVAYSTFAALLRTPSIPSELSFLASLDGGDRAAMRWVATSTPEPSRVLVITGATWSNDRVAEWFPVLAQRHSVATVQGSEWLPGGEFTRRLEAYEALSNCASRDVACVEQWAASTGKPFTHLYVTRTMGKKGVSGTDCCTAVIASAQSDPRYRRIYDGPGAAIFERR